MISPRLLAVSLVLCLFTIPEPLMATIQRLDVYRFNEKLEHGPPTMWQVEEGPPVQVHVLAGSGDILAVVKPNRGGPLLLKRWSPEGKLISSRSLDSDQAVLGSYLSVEANLTLVTHSELVQVAVPSENVAAVRRTLPDSARNADKVHVWSKGAWFQFSDHLVCVGLDGAHQPCRFGA